jgi:hemerythrin-like domain-containing protein
MHEHTHDPIEALKEEHRAIEKIADVLMKIADKLDSGEEVPLKDLLQTLDFIRTFADKCHHGKEEGILFPKLEMKGIPREGGPLGVMLYEHEVGRAAVRRMGEAIDMLARGEDRGAQQFSENAKIYAALIKDHILKEDDILYVMAESVLEEDEMEKMMGEFEEVEEKEIGKGVHEKYARLVEELSNIYLK